MLSLVRQVEDGEPVEERLCRLITPGATLGGARPKALLQIAGEPWVVKFAESGDPLDSPLIEHTAMMLATRAGIDVCETRAIRVADGHAVAIRRFDRAGPANALSEHRDFALTLAEAQAACRDVARVVDGWQAHFAAAGVTPRDLALLASQIDRDALRAQRQAA